MIGEVRVPLRCGRLRVRQQRADYRKPKTSTGTNGRKRMPQIVEADVGKTCTRANPVPRFGEVHEVPPGLRTADDVLTADRQILQDGDGRLTYGSNLEPHAVGGLSYLEPLLQPKYSHAGRKDSRTHLFRRARPAW